MMKLNKINNSLIEIINKKKDGITLKKEDFAFFINLIKSSTDLLQFGSFLTLLDIKNLNDEEIKSFIDALQENGTPYTLIQESKKNEYVMDYISIGEFNDSLDLLLGPLVVGFGLKFSLVYESSIGLHGTVFNKLASIGVSTNFSTSHFQTIFNEIDIAIIKESKSIVPSFSILMEYFNNLDLKNIYLYLSLILSYKFNIKNTVLIINLKFGELGLVKSIQTARKIANTILELANNYSKKVLIFITSADSFIGRNIGNALEIKKAIEFLNGNSELSDLKMQLKKAFAEMCYRLNLILDKNKVFDKFDDLIDSKKALNIFNRSLSKQRWNLIKYNSYRVNKFFNPHKKFDIVSPEVGFLDFKSYELFKIASFNLHIFSSSKKDYIDSQAGIHFNKLPGDKVNKGDVILTLYSSYEFENGLIDSLRNNIIIYDSRENITVKNFVQDMYDNLNLIKVIKNEN